MNVLLIFPVATCVTFFLTAILRRYALRHSVLDVPNKRSSHTITTPSGGGIALVVSFQVFAIAIGIVYNFPISLLIALLGAGTWVALIGFWDDHTHIAARWRLLAHFTSAIWALAWLDDLPALPFFGYLLDFGWLGYVLAAIYLVWLLNLYNFMDGINGIASVEAITVCLAAAILARLCVSEPLTWLLPVLLASTVLGFLFWNFPSARIFMGDTGSCFLGITIGIFSIHAALAAPQLLWSWMILLGVFIIDATLTVLRRVLRGKKIYEGHCCHAYQHAARRLGAHHPVVLAIGGINIIWLFPIALLVTLQKMDGLVGLILAYVPLVWLAIKFNCGKDHNSTHELV
jgi:Fuc2NAc and GlcNAc transferase